MRGFEFTSLDVIIWLDKLFSPELELGIVITSILCESEVYLTF